MWVIFEGPYYDHSHYNICITLTKAAAERICRTDGFKFNKKDKIWLNDEAQTWRKMEKLQVLPNR